jgi:hypothetical protein
MVAVVVCLTLGGIHAGAADEPHKCPAPGTTVNNSLGGSFRYERQEGLWCLRTRNGRPAQAELGHMRFFDESRRSGEMYEKWLNTASEIWPIAPGKSTSFIYQGTETGMGANATLGNYIYAYETRVEPPIQVTVGAGTFTAYPIISVLRGTTGNVHRSEYVFYYAPEVGTNVKFEYRPINGVTKDPPPNWELVKITPPQ